MSSQKPAKPRNGLSRFSILALLGLVAFASVVLVANPFAVHPSVASIDQTANGPSSAVSSVQSTLISGAGVGSLLTGTAPAAQSGGHHHHHDGNSSTDS